jgi:hypothetical protein
MGRWSRRVRAQLYTFELISGLTFDDSVATQAILKSGATAISTVKQPLYDSDGTGAELKKQLQYTLDMGALRPDRLAEILTQVAVPYSYFAMLLNLQPGRHRCTYELMSTSLILSGIAVMRFKHHFRIRRPTDHSPLIQPVLLTPNHGSFPAGHSTQGGILVTVLNDLVGTALGTDLPKQLDALADRVGENRIVAGVHFKPDIAAGKTLGQELGQHFINKAKIATTATAKTALQWLWKNAALEWA